MSELTPEFVYSQVRLVAGAMLLLCIACLIDFNQLKRLQQRHDNAFELFDRRTTRLDRALEGLYNDVAPKQAAAKARPRKSATAAPEQEQ